MSRESALDRLRALKTEARIKEAQSRDLRLLLKTHPARPLPGDSSRAEKWVAIKSPIEDQRQAIIDDLIDIREEVDELRAEINQMPLNGVTLNKVIDRLVAVEALFAADGHAAAWDELTSLTDWLESLEDES